MIFTFALVRRHILRTYRYRTLQSVSRMFKVIHSVCLILFLAMCADSLSAQNQVLLDSLEKEAVRATSDSARVLYLNNLAAQYIRYGMPQAAEKLRESLRLTSEYVPARWPSQKAYLQSRARTCFLHGNYYKRSGNFPEALRYYHESHEKSQLIGQDRAMGDALIGIGTVYGGYLLEFDNAIHYFSLAEEAFLRAQYAEGLMMVYGNLGAIYSDQNKVAEGLAETYKAEKIIREKGLKQFEAQVYSTLSAIYTKLDSLPQALVYAEKARIAFARDKDLMRYGDHLLVMSDLYTRMNDDAGAEKSALEAVEVAIQGQHKFIAKDAYLILQEIYLRRAKMAEPMLKDSLFLRAFYYNGLNRVYKDSLFDTEKSRQIAEIQVKFETAKKEHAISMLSAEAKDREIDILRSEVALRQARIKADRSREHALLLEQNNANIALQLEVQDAKIQGQDAESREKQREIEALNAVNQRREIEAESERTLRYALLAGLAGLVFFTFLLLRLYYQKINAGKKIEQQRAEIEAQHTRLAEVNRFKSIFLSNMSHEIRTPLNTIIGMSELMATAPLPPAEREHAQIVSHASQNLLTLINEILDFSKIESGKIDFLPKPFDLPELLRRQVSLVRFPAEQKKLALQLVCAENLPRGVVADAGRLNQILLNLLSNAVKFTERGAVTLTASLHAHLPNGQVLLQFAVRDSGVGISAEELPLIFDAFQQAGENTHLRHSGTGLGLAISKQLVELQGGKIEVESTPGRGSEFRVLLPVGLADLPDIPMAAPNAELSKLPSCKILLVEDNHFNQLLATELLRKIVDQADIAVAVNGLEAIEKAHAGGFDLIFMDVKMPRMDGFAATQALRAAGLTTPIIALTANATAEEREKCLQAGMDGYLSKPIEVGLLRAQIMQWTQ